MSLDDTVRHAPIPVDPRYLASEDGRIYSTINGKYLRRAIPEKTQYLMVSIGNGKKFYVHRLVLMAFVGPCPDGMQGLHKNDIKYDNRLENLYWGTPKQNTADSGRNGRRIGRLPKLTDKQIEEIRALRIGKRNWSIPIRDVACRYGVCVNTVKGLFQK